MPRTGKKLTLIRGRVARVTREDGCGRPVIGEYNSAITDGVITVTATANSSDTDEINVTSFTGQRCIYEPSLPELNGYTYDIQFCSVEYELFEIITGQTLVLNAAGDPVGLEVDTKIKLSDVGFGLEIWAGAQSADACDDPNAEGIYGYFLSPRVQGGILGDFTIENGALNFTISGAATRDGNQWGRGPYAVERGIGTSEVQRLTITGTPTGGTFTLGFSGQTTAPIAYNATASAVQAALEALTTVGDGDILVSGGPGPGTPYTFTFAGSLAQRDVPLLVATGSFAGGSSPAGVITVVTPGVGGIPDALYQPVSRTAALRMMETTVAPPVPVIGARPVLDPSLPALGSIAGVVTGRTAAFTATPASTGPVWYDFGDDEWDYVAAPGTASHDYDAPGTYTVRASQNGKNWSTTTVTITA